MKKPQMKRLGVGYIWFRWEPKIGDYAYVRLSKKPSSTKAQDCVRLKLHNLGAWQKVKLWAEIVE